MIPKKEEEPVKKPEAEPKKADTEDLSMTANNEGTQKLDEVAPTTEDLPTGGSKAEPQISTVPEEGTQKSEAPTEPSVTVEASTSNAGATSNTNDTGANDGNDNTDMEGGSEMEGGDGEDSLDEAVEENLAPHVLRLFFRRDQQCALDLPRAVDTLSFIYVDIDLKFTRTASQQYRKYEPLLLK